MKKLIPKPLLRTYHFTLATISAFYYGNPSKKIKVVGVTGTKGKTTTAELLNAVLEAGGYKTALAGTLRFKIGSRSRRNLKKMTMPGRFFLQSFIKEAVNEGCEWVVLEMTSAGAEQFRHRGIELDAFVFLNLSPEHIEYHGSLERYRAAKRELARSLERSKKRPRILILNRDSEEAKTYLDVEAETKLTYSLKDAGEIELTDKGTVFELGDEKVKTNLLGEFNVSNMMAAAAFGSALDIDLLKIKQAFESFRGIRGRAEPVAEGQRFEVIVDYAHTPDSLEAIYKAFEDKEIIAVLGNAGGGRDTWKRPEMGAIADRAASQIYLTNEDPYDENPRKIVEEMAEGIKETPFEIIMDRRKAIRKSLEHAESLVNQGHSVAVLITGKGTDPYIMGPKGTKQPWDDAKVVREELRKLMNRSAIKGR